jgi:hypothetical protein
MSLTTEEVFVNQKLINAPTSNLRLRVFMILLLVGGLTLLGTFQFGAESQQEWRTNALKGKVAMTEVQLKNLVVTEKIAVYWTGPIANNLYTLDTSKKNQSILTYLSQKSKDKKVIASSRVIGTYFSPSAFSDSLNVATKANNVSFKNANGNLVFYSKDRETGVFVAIPNTNYQIEIFDPIPGQAISIATLRDQLTKIGI